MSDYQTQEAAEAMERVSQSLKHVAAAIDQIDRLPDEPGRAEEVTEQLEKAMREAATMTVSACNQVHRDIPVKSRGRG
jgi:hypothetical protein